MPIAQGRAKWPEIKRLREQGYSVSAIARQVRMHVSAVAYALQKMELEAAEKSQRNEVTGGMDRVQDVSVSAPVQIAAHAAAAAETAAPESPCISCIHRVVCRYREQAEQVRIWEWAQCRHYRAEEGAT